MADALNGLKQDNSANLQFVIRNVDANVNRTVISFRYYAHKSSSFSIANGSYLTANGKKYKLIAADSITLDENHYTQVKASESTDEFLGNTYYSDFTLTFEPGLAQEIKMNETRINDYIPMLNQKGYQAYSFDVSTIKGRNVTLNVREFVGSFRTHVAIRKGHFYSTRILCFILV